MKKIKTATFFVTLVLLIVTYTAVYASSYKSSVYFQGEYEGAVREYNGQNISYSATTSSTNPNHINKVYWVTLRRKNLVGYTKIGKSTALQRDGHNTAKWSNVGPGKYYIYFEKARDGMHVSSDNVIIKNY